MFSASDLSLRWGLQKPEGSTARPVLSRSLLHDDCCSLLEAVIIYLVSAPSFFLRACVQQTQDLPVFEGCCANGSAANGPDVLTLEQGGNFQVLAPSGSGSDPFPIQKSFYERAL